MTEVIETNTGFISLVEEGIIRVQGKDKVQIEVEDIDDNLRAFQKLRNNQKTAFLLLFGEEATISKEAREKFANKQRNSMKKAEALVISAPYHRLIANFHIAHFKPEFPTKIFTCEQEAIEWLRQFT